LIVFQGAALNLVAIQKLGRNRDTPRLWLESQRLNALGFSPGTALTVELKPQELVLRPAVLGNNHVSSRVVAGGRRPIIDLENESLLSGLSPYSEVKIIASFERIQVTPSHRAFAIQRSRSCNAPFRTLEVFAGGGTMTAALHGNSAFQVVAGIEVEPTFADEWQGANPQALLIQSDIRAVHQSDLPEFDVLIGGIPCTCHSNLGRAKKQLAGKPELGDSGDLFLPALTLVSERMPAAVVFENVPTFENSLAGELLVSTLRRIGYHVSTNVIAPNSQWGEIEDRKRWLMVATLDSPFALSSPGKACATPLAEFLDARDARLDQADCARIARTIEGLKAHNERHRAQGHGFGFSVISETDTSIPVIPKSYPKINTGPFVQTPFGLRLLRQSEVERIHGVQLHTQHPATALQILGQGVQTRIFRQIFQQLGIHLSPESAPHCHGAS
jgi:DNA (cytosine-5)-methyltransferase 1